MGYVWTTLLGAVANVNLDATRIANPAMNEPDALEDRRHELPFEFDITVSQLLAGVVVREVAVEAHFGELVGDANGPPDVLGDRCPMGLDVNWDRVLL